MKYLADFLVEINKGEGAENLYEVLFEHFEKKLGKTNMKTLDIVYKWAAILDQRKLYHKSVDLFFTCYEGYKANLESREAKQSEGKEGSEYNGNVDIEELKLLVQDAFEQYLSTMNRLKY